VQGYWWGRLGLLGACALAQLVLLGGPTEALPAEPPAPVPTAFDGTRAYTAVRELVERYPRRTTGSDADAAAATWMAERLAALGLPVQEQSFRAWGTWGDERLAPHAGRNVVAVSAGAEPRAVVIGAHRDVAPGTVQGAEDNGSGSGALLEMARVLSATPHRLSFVFVSFGAEEIGLGGSRYYLAHPVLPTALALSLDAVGQANGQRLTLLDAWSLPAPLTWELGRRAETAALVDAPPGRGALALLRLEPLLGAGVTDSLPFALRSEPAVGLSWGQPPYRDAHTPRDTLDRIAPEPIGRVGALAESLVRQVDAHAELLAGGAAEYLLSPDGRYVPPERVSAAGLALALLAVTQAGLAIVAVWREAAGAEPDPAPAWIRVLVETRFVLAALGAAALAGLVPLVQPRDTAPGPAYLLAWTAWWTLLVALPGVVRRRGWPPSVAVRRAELVAACSLSYLGFAWLVNPYFALLAAGYPLLVLSWTPLGASTAERRLGWLVLAPWGVVALAALLVVGVASVFSPEIVPPTEAAWASALLVLPVAVVLALLRDRRAAGRTAATLAQHGAFR
jgi:hypothetical protein